MSHVRDSDILGMSLVELIESKPSILSLIASNDVIMGGHGEVKLKIQNISCDHQFKKSTTEGALVEKKRMVCSCFLQNNLRGRGVGREK